MKSFDCKTARETLERRDKKEEERNARLLEKARSDFNTILQEAVKYNPIRIYQWGSLLDVDSFNAASDIDIAVEGIENTEDFFRLHREVEALTDFTVDLVQIEKIEPEFKNIIRKKGRLVYEKD